MRYLRKFSPVPLSHSMVKSHIHCGQLIAIVVKLYYGTARSSNKGCWFSSRTKRVPNRLARPSLLCFRPSRILYLGKFRLSRLSLTAERVSVPHTKSEIFSSIRYASRPSVNADPYSFQVSLLSLLASTIHRLKKEFIRIFGIDIYSYFSPSGTLCSPYFFFFIS